MGQPQREQREGYGKLYDASAPKERTRWRDAKHVRALRATGRRYADASKSELIAEALASPPMPPRPVVYTCLSALCTASLFAEGERRKALIRLGVRKVSSA